MLTGGSDIIMYTIQVISDDLNYQFTSESTAALISVPPETKTYGFKVAAHNVIGQGDFSKIMYLSNTDVPDKCAPIQIRFRNFSDDFEFDTPVFQENGE